jgi:hypothetical protein
MPGSQEWQLPQNIKVGYPHATWKSFSLTLSNLEQNDPGSFAVTSKLYMITSEMNSRVNYFTATAQVVVCHLFFSFRTNQDAKKKITSHHFLY